MPTITIPQTADPARAARLRTLGACAVGARRTLFGYPDPAGIDGISSTIHRHLVPPASPFWIATKRGRVIPIAGDAG